jgi:release factor glutamine methyltransferase
MEPFTVPSSIPTPTYSHIKSDDFVDVYEPAEDSFLLLDALESELQYLEKVQPSICVEIGPGSGIISAAIGSVFRSKIFVLSCDINPQVS